MKFGRHAGIRQPAGVGDVLVAEDVQVADVDVGVGKPGQIGRAGGCGVRRNVVTAGLVAEQCTPAGEVVVIGPRQKPQQRRCRVSQAGRRASGRSAAAGQRRDHRGRAPSGTRRPPAHRPRCRPSRRAGPDRNPACPVFGQPLQRRIAVFDGRRVRMLGRDAVVDHAASARPDSATYSRTARSYIAPMWSRLKIMPPPWRYSTALPGWFARRSPIPGGGQRCAVACGHRELVRCPRPRIGAVVAATKSNMRWPPMRASRRRRPVPRRSSQGLRSAGHLCVAPEGQGEGPSPDSIVAVREHRRHRQSRPTRPVPPFAAAAVVSIAVLVTFALRRKHFGSWLLVRRGVHAGDRPLASPSYEYFFPPPADRDASSTSDATRARFVPTSTRRAKSPASAGHARVFADRTTASLDRISARSRTLTVS